MSAAMPILEGGHRLLVYSDGAQLVASVGAFTARALGTGGAALLVGTPAHLDGVEQWATLLGADVGQAATHGRYQRVDLAQVLGLLETAPDPARAFRQLLLDALRLVPAGSRPVGVFGEIVAALWEARKVTAALDIEKMGTRLSEEEGVEIVCGYPVTTLTTGGDAARVGSCHADTVEPEPALAADVTEAGRLASSAFPATPASCQAARALVRSTCVELGLRDEVVDTAELVASELAANAVRHVGSPFTLWLTQTDRASVRLSVTDGGAPPTSPAEMPVSRTRGLGIVAALSSRWGIEETVGGKVVWAEIPR